MARKKKSEGGEFDKESNAPRNADELRDYAGDFAKRVALIHAQFISAAERMDPLGADFRVTFVLSMVPRLLKEMEDRLDTQLKKKLKREITKAKAERILREAEEEDEEKI